MDWRDLADGARIRLREALSPLIADAVPSCFRFDAAPSLSAQVVPVAELPASIIVGRFMERAEKQFGKMRGSSHAGAHSAATGQATARARSLTPWRRSARQRSADHLVTLCLPGRLLAVIEQLARTPGVVLDDLAALLASEEPSIARYLRQLDDFGLIAVASSRDQADLGNEQANEQARESPAYWLSAHGARLDALFHERHERTARPPLTQEEGALLSDTGGSRHDVGIVHFFALLTREGVRVSTPAIPCALAWWEIGALIERRYQLEGRWRVVRPDGEGMYSVGGQRMWFWLEWDRGTMSGADLARKLAHYAGYAASEERRLKDGETLPLLLFVVEGRGQFERLRWAVEQTPMEGALAISATYARLLEERGPLASIWWPISQGEGWSGPEKLFS
jgi:hypothetical protein